MACLSAIDGGFEDAALLFFGIPNVTDEVPQGEGAWVEGAAGAGVTGSLLFCCGVYGVRYWGGKEIEKH